jgi:hypothetical protein
MGGINILMSLMNELQIRLARMDERPQIRLECLQIAAMSAGISSQLAVVQTTAEILRMAAVTVEMSLMI